MARSVGPAPKSNPTTCPQTGCSDEYRARQDVTALGADPAAALSAVPRRRDRAGLRQDRVRPARLGAAIAASANLRCRGGTVTTGLPRLTPREAARARRARAGDRRRQRRRRSSRTAGSRRWSKRSRPASTSSAACTRGSTSMPSCVEAAAERLRPPADRRAHAAAPTSRSAPGRKRSGKRLLTVGTDCALGKKYTALAIARALRGSAASMPISARPGRPAS